MNSEHLTNLCQSHTGERTATNGRGDEVQDPLDAVLGAAWAISMLLAAYDHELFAMHRPGTEAVWNATLCALLDARSRVLAEAIPLRLREYRERVAGVAVRL